VEYAQSRHKKQQRKSDLRNATELCYLVISR